MDLVFVSWLYKGAESWVNKGRVVIGDKTSEMRII